MTTTNATDRYYVCPGVNILPYDIAEWGGDRLGVEFADAQDARRLVCLLNEGKAVKS